MQRLYSCPYCSRSLHQTNLYSTRNTICNTTLIQARVGVDFARLVIHGDIVALLNTTLCLHRNGAWYRDSEVDRDSKHAGTARSEVAPMKFIVENFASTTCRASSLTSEINDARRLSGALHAG